MANTTLKTKIILRNDTEANWAKVNPVLCKGEAGFCNDGRYFKFGDGTTTWQHLPKFESYRVLLNDFPPSQENVNDFEVGTLWLSILSKPTGIYMLTDNDNTGRAWQELLSEQSMTRLGVLREKDFAHAAGAGAATGYVDKALTADKLTHPRTFTFTGGVMGSAAFDGGSNISITTSLSIAEKDVPALSLSKIRGVGTAASHNVGLAAGQIPVLDAAGQLDASVLPQLAVVDVVEAESDAQMIAANVQKGDICLRSDNPAGAYILAGNDPHVLANWKRIPTPAQAVLSVNGKTGVVSLTSDTIAEGVNNRYYTDQRVSSYLQSPDNIFIMDGGNA